MTLIHWIAISQADSFIQPLYNSGMISTSAGYNTRLCTIYSKLPEPTNRKIFEINVLKVSQTFPTEISKQKCAYHLQFFNTSSRHLGIMIRLNSSQALSVIWGLLCKCKWAIPLGILFFFLPLGIFAYYLYKTSTNRFLHATKIKSKKPKALTFFHRTRSI